MYEITWSAQLNRQIGLLITSSAMIEQGSSDSLGVVLEVYNILIVARRASCYPGKVSRSIENLYISHLCNECRVYCRSEDMIEYGKVLSPEPH